MTSKNIERPLCTLRFNTENTSYEQNLQTLLSLIDEAPKGAIVVAPEVCLTNFDYDHFDKAADFAEVATSALLEASAAKSIILTMIERRNDGIYNIAKVFHKGEVVHEQAKAHLFRFGGEHDYFSEGSEDEIVLFELDGIKMGIIICFELRFKTLWQKLEGADIIAIPAQWGKIRTESFITLTNALAVINQCYVAASDTSNSDMTGMSGIITPFGEEMRNGEKPCLKSIYRQKEIEKMRRYLPVGIE
jgi:predicted amidohydrolase